MAISTTVAHYIKSFSWMMLENIVKTFLGLVVTIYVIRYLGPTDFGLLSFGLSIVGILYPVTTLGLDAILFRNIIKNIENERTLIHTAKVLRLYTAILLTLIVSIYIYNLSLSGNLKCVLELLLLGLIIESFSIYKEYFSAIVRTKYIAISSIFSMLSSSILKIVFIVLKFNVVWFALAFLVQKIVNVMALKYFYNKRSSVNSNMVVFDKMIAKDMLTDSWPLIFTSFTGLLYMYTDQLLIKYFLNLTQVGLYAGAVKLVMFFYVIPSIISNIIYPKIIKLREKLSKSEFVYKMSMIYFFNLFIACSILVVFMLFSERIVLFLLGEEFTSSSEVLLIYCFGLIFVFFQANNNKLLIMENLQKLMLSRNILGLSINFFLNIILIPKYGIKGAAFATVCTEIIIMMSYGLNDRTRYIMFLQLSAPFYPIYRLRKQKFSN